VKLIVGKPSLDIAILKIEAIGLPRIVMGDSDYVQEGEQVVAIGNPLGLERTISNGIISGVHSSNNIELIQMTTPVSRGSSGGPIINVYGQVIGITTLATEWGAQNLNFAIPINYIKAIILSSEK
jgi:S1-C subfamily serine protease